MKICILTIGTRGDVQPYVALSKGLMARGHEVVIGAPDNFRDFVVGQGVGFHPLGIDLKAFLETPEAREILNGNWFALRKIWKDMIGLMLGVLEETWNAARDADMIIYHPKAGGAVDVAEKTGARLIYAAPIPLLPTGDFPMIMPVNFGRTLNRLTYKFFNLSRIGYRMQLNKFRAEKLGLGKGPAIAQPGEYSGDRAGEMGPRLVAVSSAVVPRPADWRAEDYLTGYWFLDEESGWQPDAALDAFLGAGDPPVYIGFGSMTTRDPEGLARTIVKAVEKAGVRALLATGWGGLEKIEVPDSVYMIDKAPHGELFKHVAGVVHHGGAGSTAAGLRAGRPTLVCPMTVDQPFWGRIVWKLGAGPKPQKLRKLQADQFADGLRDLLGNAAYRERAEEISTAIAQEDGVARAIEIIENYNT